MLERFRSPLFRLLVVLTTAKNKLFDSDRDGYVTKFELKEALWSLGQHPGEEEMDAIFTEYDSDKSGALEFNEFKRLMLNRLSYKVGVNLLLCLRSVARNLLHSSSGGACTHITVGETNSHVRTGPYSDSTVAQPPESPHSAPCAPQHH